MVLPNDLSFTDRLIALLNIIRPASVVGVQVHFSLNFKQTSIRRKIESIIFNPRLNPKWYLLNNFFGCRKFLNFDRRHERHPDHPLYCEAILKNCVDKESLIKTKIDGLIIGDLIYDTYIRFKPHYTVNLDDPFLLFLIRKTADILIECKEFISKNNFETLVTTYTTYLHYGVLTRLCLEKGIKVYAVGSINQLVVQPTIKFPSHQRNFHQYRNWAEQFLDKNKIREIADQIITARFSGTIDPVMFYMNQSAYKNPIQDIALNPTKKSALIMAHDFYDSPHGWGDMLFEDFYEWLDFTLKTASETNHDFYLKPHPNAIRESLQVYQYFFEKYPKIKRIPTNTSNTQLATLGFTCAVTLSGSVAHEFAYLGLPTISAGENPHSSFSFTRHPKSKEEYATWLNELNIWKPDIEEVRSFIFMHNYCLAVDRIPQIKNYKNPSEYLVEFKDRILRTTAALNIELDAIKNKQALY